MVALALAVRSFELRRQNQHKTSMHRDVCCVSSVHWYTEHGKGQHCTARHGTSCVGCRTAVWCTSVIGVSSKEEENGNHNKWEIHQSSRWYMIVNANDCDSILRKRKELQHKQITQHDRNMTAVSRNYHNGCSERQGFPPRCWCLLFELMRCCCYRWCYCCVRLLPILHKFRCGVLLFVLLDPVHRRYFEIPKRELQRLWRRGGCHIPVPTRGRHNTNPALDVEFTIYNSVRAKIADRRYCLVAYQAHQPIMFCVWREPAVPAATSPVAWSGAVLCGKRCYATECDLVAL